MEIFIIRDGHQTGPFSRDAVQVMLADGKIHAQDAGWHKGLPAWLPVSELLRHDSMPPAQEHVPGPRPGSATSDDEAPMTAKQRAFLKYLGAEFGERITKAKAALAISEALENPKLQNRIRKWQDEKLRLHPEEFKDEIDFRRANRAVRYLELCQTEGAEVVQDVTKAHVQVLIESLDKQHPSWEAEPNAALWDYLFPSIEEHFPKLVRPAWKGRLRVGGRSKVAAAATGGIQAGRQPSVTMLPPPAPPGVLMAIGRGIVYGVIVLGLIIGGKSVWDKSQSNSSTPPSASPPAAPAPAKSGPPASDTTNPAAPSPAPPEKPAAAENPPPSTPAPAPEQEKPPVAPLAAAAPPPAPQNPEPPEPAPATPLTENKPPAPVESTPAPPAPAPSVAEEKPATPPPAPALPPEPVAPRTSITLLQGIAVGLTNGQATLPAGTRLQFIALEGTNVRVAWNNNVFLVPAAATDVGANPPPVPAAAAVRPVPVPPPQPVPASGTKPAPKPSDDL
jgi:hypothetical protein